MSPALADRVLERVTACKRWLAARPVTGRWLVPAVEVLEVWISDGPVEVMVRVRRRFGSRSISPPPHYMEVAQGPLPDLTLPPSGQDLTVSIVVPVLDHPALTHRCLKAIIAHTAAGTYEVIVVDNGSNAGTRAMLSRVANLRIIRNAANAGFVEACNQGARQASGEYLLFLNNDTVVLPGWLEALTSTARANPRAGAVGAKLLYPDGRLQEAGGIVWNDGGAWNYGRDGDPQAPEFCYVREVDYCSGACLLVRRALFELLEGFDLRYAPGYYEDTDLCFRLRERGSVVLYQPLAEVVHEEGATAGTDTTAGFKRHQVRNQRIFASRHRTALTGQAPCDPRTLRRARDRKRARRILIVDHMVPHEQEDSGSVRMMEILRALVDLGHAVTFLPDDLAGAEPYTREMQQLGVETLYGPMNTAAWVRRHAAEFDVVILCRAHFAAKYLAAVLGAGRLPFLIFDTVDLHYLREARQAALRRNPALTKRAARTRAVELSVVQESDMVWVTSPQDADELRPHAGGAAVEVVPNVHRVRWDVPGAAGRGGLLFIGGFRHPPNEDAVFHFVSNILPLVRRRGLGAPLIVVGSHMPRRVRDLASPDVLILGYVERVEPIFDSCRLSIAPLRYGAGLKGKVGQSLAWGLPVVTTTIGAEGLGLIDRQHALIADEPAEIADRIVELFEDDALWTRMSENGRRHVESRFGRESVRSTLRAILDRAVRATDEPTLRG